MSSYYAAITTTFIDSMTERPSASLPKTAIERMFEKTSRSFEGSYFLASQNVFDKIQRNVEVLSQLPTNWNSYGAPAPEPSSIQRAKPILKALRTKLLEPDRVFASADGGVSLVFVSRTESRAAIESLNSGERFILLYDLSGNSKTIDWPEDDDQGLTLVDKLRNHLRSKGLAATR